MKNVENFTLENYVLASPGIRCVGQMIDFFVSFSIFTLVLWGGLEIGIEKELFRATAVTAAVSYYLFLIVSQLVKVWAKNFWALQL
ncbi:TPA: hypothetical protein ACPJ01_003788 [Vibrio diabolicus]